MAEGSGVQLEGLERRLRRWRITSIVLGVVVLFLGVVVAGQLTAGGTMGGEVEASASGDAGTGVADLARRDADDPLALGDVDAPIVIIEWADYRCPYCAAFANDTLPALLDEYIEAGLVRYEFNDVVFFGDDSLSAAIAGRAAASQGKFAEFMAALYAAAPETGHPDLPRETLIGFAETAGVPDLDRFVADLDSAELEAEVAASTTYAQQLGVTSVPFFVVGDTVIAGAQPIEQFRQLIDEQLAQIEG